MTIGELYQSYRVDQNILFYLGIQNQPIEKAWEKLINIEAVNLLIYTCYLVPTILPYDYICEILTKYLLKFNADNYDMLSKYFKDYGIDTIPDFSHPKKLSVKDRIYINNLVTNHLQQISANSLPNFIVYTDKNSLKDNAFKHLLYIVDLLTNPYFVSNFNKVLNVINAYWTENARIQNCSNENSLLPDPSSLYNRPYQQGGNIAAQFYGAATSIINFNFISQDFKVAFMETMRSNPNPFLNINKDKIQGITDFNLRTAVDKYTQN